MLKDISQDQITIFGCITFNFKHSDQVLKTKKKLKTIFFIITIGIILSLVLFVEWIGTLTKTQFWSKLPIELGLSAIALKYILRHFRERCEIIINRRIWERYTFKKPETYVDVEYTEIDRK